MIYFNESQIILYCTLNVSFCQKKKKPNPDNKQKANVWVIVNNYSQSFSPFSASEC